MGHIYRWFKKDENAVPAVYVLQPISSVYPDYLLHDDLERQKRARDDWWKDFLELQDILVEGARKKLSDPDRINQYSMSGMVWCAFC